MKNKKKVLLVSRNLMAGGVETSSINFIQNMKDDIDLEAFFCNYDGILKNKIPDGTKVYDGNKLLKFFSGADNYVVKMGQRSKFKNLVRNVVKFFYNKFGVKKFLKWLAVKRVNFKNEYDCAICFFAQNDLCSQIVLKRVKAKQKIAFIHTDVSVSPLPHGVYKLLFKYDKIMCVSRSSAELFRSKYPELSYKTDYIYNFQDNDKIKHLSNQFNVNYPNMLNIITVARLSDEQKAFFRALNVFKRLHDEGHKFCWHIVGDGIDRIKINNYINDNNMQEYVVLHGNQSNPYPYIKASDIFFLGSRYESWGIVMIEALTLGVPVLTTNTSSAYEILGDKGFICDNNETAIYDKLKYVLRNIDLIALEKDKIQNYNFDNDSNKQKLLNILSN